MIFDDVCSVCSEFAAEERALQLFGQVYDMQSDGLSLDTAALGAALAACQTGGYSTERGRFIGRSCAPVYRCGLASELGNLGDASGRGTLAQNY